MKPYEKLKHIRLKKGKTTYELSELTGIPQSTISKMENGKRKIETDSLELLSQALEVPISSFFDENINSTNETNISASNNLKTTKSPSKYELLEDKYKKLIDKQISELLKLQQDENNSK